MTDHNTQALGRKVRERRESLGLSVRQAAAAAGVTRATWSDVELGRRGQVRVRTLDAIDRALRFRPGTLADLTGVTNVETPGGERRITVVLQAAAPEEMNAREELVRYATTLSDYDVQRVLTYIDRLPPPPDIDRYVREAVERTVAELLAVNPNLAVPQAAASKSAHRKVS
jgi:transcriptional regulator with XRE-family HTH domain